MDGDEMRLKVKSQKLKVKSYNSQKGLTLIEVLVALTILAIGLLGVALMQVSSISGNVYSKEMAIATELGQDMIEKLKTSTYTSTVVDSTLTAGAHTNAELSNANGNPQPNPIDGRGMSTNLAGASVPLLLYTRIWNVTDNGLGTGTNMKTIVVTVSWAEKGNALNTRSIQIRGVKVRNDKT
jgi:type IV pilus assembly protein PilV